jgi:hypothetical protein
VTVQHGQRSQRQRVTNAQNHPAAASPLGFHARRGPPLGWIFLLSFFVEWLIQVLTPIKTMLELTAQEATNHKQRTQDDVNYDSN